MCCAVVARLTHITRLCLGFALACGAPLSNSTIDTASSQRLPQTLWATMTPMVGGCVCVWWWWWWWRLVVVVVVVEAVSVCGGGGGGGGWWRWWWW